MNGRLLSPSVHISLQSVPQSPLTLSDGDLITADRLTGFTGFNPPANILKPTELPYKLAKDQLFVIGKRMLEYEYCFIIINSCLPDEFVMALIFCWFVLRGIDFTHHSERINFGIIVCQLNKLSYDDSLYGVLSKIDYLFERCLILFFARHLHILIRDMYDLHILIQITLLGLNPVRFFDVPLSSICDELNSAMENHLYVPQGALICPMRNRVTTFKFLKGHPSFGRESSYDKIISTGFYQVVDKNLRSYKKSKRSRTKKGKTGSKRNLQERIPRVAKDPNRYKGMVVYQSDRQMAADIRFLAEICSLDNYGHIVDQVNNYDPSNYLDPMTSTQKSNLCKSILVELFQRDGFRTRFTLGATDKSTHWKFCDRLFKTGNSPTYDGG